jgi:crotonobetainyl-CoA:carnitine CoA-transferase CaiB-like acyl-CoA transferase
LGIITDKPAFAGIKIIDLTQGLAGPYCAMLMTQNGADVMKVEPPEGDWSRRLGKPVGQRSAAYFACNRGKRAIVADLKSDDGLALVRKLAAGADVFMESNRAGVANRLGLGYEALKAENPDLIYLSITGFGQDGPYADRPATDAVLQAFSGLMVSNPDKDGAPKRIEFPVPDYTTGLIAYQTLFTALFGRAMHGGGRRLDVSLMQAMLLYQQQGLITRELDPTPPKGSPLPPTGTYQAADGYVNISIMREKFFQALCQVLNLPGLAADERLQSVEGRRDNADEMIAAVRLAISGWQVKPLSTAFAEADVPHAIVNDYPAAARDPHVAAVEGIRRINGIPGAPPLPYVNVPGAAKLSVDDPRSVTPDLDTHRAEILAELAE